jgi:hypothetical protein
MRNLGTSDLENVSKAGKTPHEAIQKLIINMLKYVCNVLAGHHNAHGHFWASGFGALQTCTSHRQCLLQDNSGLH